MGVRSVPLGARSIAAALDAVPAVSEAESSPRPRPADDVPSSRAASVERSAETPAHSLAEAAAPPGAPNHLGREAKLRILTDLNQSEVTACSKCVLCEQRTQTVFGEGDPDAKLMFIGEGPGETEDKTGRPFVGRAGDLLDKMIVAMGFKREDVYIANVVKCRPPGNRAPTPAEVEACWGFLKRQLMTIQPRAIVTLGGPATKLILSTDKGITSIRGQWDTFRGLAPEGPYIAVMPTFHPAYVLRNYNEETRRKVWSDLKKVKAFLDTADATPV